MSSSQVYPTFCWVPLFLFSCHYISESAIYNYEVSNNEKFICVGSDLSYNWTEAEIYCENTFGSHLAAIHSLSENNDAIGDGSWYLEYGEMWIGLNDIEIEGNYSWIDDSPFDYENWFHKDIFNTSQENCIGIVTIGGEWDDISCSTGHYAFICRGIMYIFIKLLDLRAISLCI